MEIRRQKALSRRLLPSFPGLSCSLNSAIPNYATRGTTIPN